MQTGMSLLLQVLLVLSATIQGLKIKDIRCEQKKVSGFCGLSGPKWFFNAETGACETFEYGGCGDTGNLFASFKHCMDVCAPLVHYDPCNCGLPLRQGNCNETSERWYFNSRSGQCEQFSYHGCNGNMNRFHYLKECKAKCEDPFKVCRLPVASGTCQALSLLYRYDHKTDTCEQFPYGGCGGNQNMFRTPEDCASYCRCQQNSDDQYHEAEHWNFI